MPASVEIAPLLQCGGRGLRRNVKELEAASDIVEAGRDETLDSGSWTGVCLESSGLSAVLEAKKGVKLEGQVSLLSQLTLRGLNVGSGEVVADGDEAEQGVC